MDRFNRILKVYCEEHLLKEIEKKVKKGISDYQYHSEKISYRGKNLKNVVAILKEAKEDPVNGGNLVYNIFYQTRNIEIIANKTYFEEVKNKILKLSGSEKG
jgi:hypothetical protein